MFNNFTGAQHLTMTAMIGEQITLRDWKIPGEPLIGDWVIR